MPWIYRLPGGLFIAAVLLFVALGALALAHAYAQPDPLSPSKCFVTLMGAKWPMWLGCAMAAHQSLAGGLIGAFGALMAGWLAWSAVWRQIADTRTHRLIDFSNHQESRIQMRKAELNSLKAYNACAKEILKHTAIHDRNSKPLALITTILELNSTGALNLPTVQTPATSPANDLWPRISALQSLANQATPPSINSPADRRSNEASIISAAANAHLILEKLKNLTEQVDQTIIETQNEIARMSDDHAAFLERTAISPDGASFPHALQPGRARRAFNSIFGRLGKCRSMIS